MANTRPSRLTNIRKSTAAARQITQRNANESPFFKLPPEVRNLIYRFALGGHHIHVTQNRHNLGDLPRFSICEHYDYDPDEVEQVKKDELNSCWNATAAVLNCSSRPYTDLLRVSRQIYDEAALIPFAANTFVFGGAWWADRFSQLNACLVPAQSRAIQHIVLYSAMRSRPPHGVLNMARALSGLKTLRLVIELHRGWRVEQFDPRIAAFRSFKQCRLQSASIVLEKRGWKGRDGK